jgi:hypothetical protein
MINCPFKGAGRDSLPCEATPELRRASQCPDCIALYLRDKARILAYADHLQNRSEAKA